MLCLLGFVLGLCAEGLGEGEVVLVCPFDDVVDGVVGGFPGVCGWVPLYAGDGFEVGDLELVVGGVDFEFVFFKCYGGGGVWVLW